MDELLQEVGVAYYRDDYSWSKIPPGFYEYRYQRINLKTNQTSYLKVCCLCEGDFLRLLDHWNDSQWVYRQGTESTLSNSQENKEHDRA